MPLRARKCTAFILAASHAHKRCCFRGLRHIFHTAVHAGFQNVLQVWQPFCFLRSAFAIDRGRSRFRAQNAPHSFRRLLSLARSQAMLLPLSALHISYSCTLHSKCSAGTATIPLLTLARSQAMLLPLSALHISYSCMLHSKCSAGTATIPLLTLDRLRHCRVGCRSVRGNALHSFRRLFTPARKRCSSCRLRYIFRTALHAIFQNDLRHGNSSAFCVPTSALTAEDAALCAEYSAFTPASSHARPPLPLTA